jgi:hypothetical protein
LNSNLAVIAVIFCRNESVVRGHRQATEAHIGTNGYVSFGTGGAAGHYTYGNSLPIPSTQAIDGVWMDGLVALLWADYDLASAAAGSGIFYSSDATSLTVTYSGVPYCCGSPAPANTFQAIFYQSGTFKLQYQAVTEGGSQNPSVGLENHDGSLGLQIAYGWAAAPAAGSAFLVGHPSALGQHTVQFADQFADGWGAGATWALVDVCGTTIAAGLGPLAGDAGWVSVPFGGAGVPCFDEATCPYFDNDKAPASPFCAFPAQSVAIPSASKCNLGVASLYLPGTPVEEGTWADRPHGCGFIAEATHYLGPFINMGITEIVDTCQWANDGTCDVPSQWNAP